MTTTLQQAAQALMDAVKLDRHDTEDWPEASRKAFNELSTALADEKAQAVEPVGVVTFLPGGVRPILSRLPGARLNSGDKLYTHPAPPPADERKKVGDSRFESWYSESAISHERKQAMREAYEAGLNEAQQVAVPYDQQALELCESCGWKAVIPGEPCLNCGRGEVMKALDAYAAERDALMADAARYQFMKSCSRVTGLDIGGWHSWTCQIMRNDIKGATLDEAIDSAIKKAGIETKTDWSAA